MQTKRRRKPKLKTHEKDEEKEEKKIKWKRRKISKEGPMSKHEEREIVRRPSASWEDRKKSWIERGENLNNNGLSGSDQGELKQARFEWILFVVVEVIE